MQTEESTLFSHSCIIKSLFSDYRMLRKSYKMKDHMVHMKDHMYALILSLTVTIASHNIINNIIKKLL